jgi:hypothetical protein
MLLIWDGKQLKFRRLLSFREFMPRWWTFLDQRSGLVRAGRYFHTAPACQETSLGTLPNCSADALRTESY